MASTSREKKRIWMMPQEVEVWYVLPAIRRELTRLFIEKEIPQKQIAKMLGVTEPAVTQYKIQKSARSRGDQIEIPDKLISEVDTAAERILEAYRTLEKDETVYETMTGEINRIIRILRDEGVICKVHREYCKHVGEECKACKKYGR